MKRIFSALLAAALLWLAGIPGLTGAASMTAPDSVEIQVYAKATHTTADHYYEAPPVGGEYSVVTGDGTIITLVPSPMPTGLYLVVYEITASDPQAYSWFSGCTSQLGSPRKYYEIYFADAAGNRVGQAYGMVTVTFPGGTVLTQVHALSTGGVLTRLSSHTWGQSLIFALTGSGYYILSAAPAATPPTESDNPGTGDDSHLYFWSALMTLSGCGCILLTASTRRKQKR